MMKRLLLSTALLMLCLFAAPQSATAFDAFNGVCNTAGSPNSSVCKDNTSGTSNPIVDDLTSITNIVAYVGGAAAIIMVIVSALRFITAGSDTSTGSRTDTDVEDARRSIANALIGLAVIVLGRLLIIFVLKKI